MELELEKVVGPHSCIGIVSYIEHIMPLVSLVTIVKNDLYSLKR